MDIFTRVKFARTMSGLSQGQLGQFCGVNQTAMGRYERSGEGGREPGPGKISLISHATGFPEKWLRDGTTFKGPVAGQIERPGEVYTAKTIRLIEDNLAELLPKFIEDNIPDHIIAMAPEYGSQRAFVVSNNDYCLVLFAVETAAAAANALGLSPEYGCGRMSKDDWLRAYLQPKAQYLRELLRSALSDFSDLWWGDIRDKGVHEWDGGNARYNSICLKFILPEGATKVEEKWIKGMMDYLDIAGCTEIKPIPSEVQYPPEPKYPAFAPANFKMQWLDD